MKKKDDEKITKKWLIGDIVTKKPKVAKMLMSKYGLGCVGCPMAAMETIEEGAMAHGFSKKEVEELVEELNK